MALASARRPAPFATTFKRIFMRAHVFVYRATGGRVGHRLGPATTLLLTTIGRKTGKPRVTPITYFRDGDDYILVASNYGAPTDPLWWRNLQREPHAQIQVKGQQFTVVAAAATGDNQARLAEMAMRANPTYPAYLKKTTRAIPLVILHPLAAM